MVEVSTRTNERIETGTPKLSRRCLRGSDKKTVYKLLRLRQTYLPARESRRSLVVVFVQLSLLGAGGPRIRKHSRQNPYTRAGLLIQLWIFISGRLFDKLIKDFLARLYEVQGELL